jgi:tRNA pseudouridine38-40 synthase
MIVYITDFLIRGRFMAIRIKAIAEYDGTDFCGFQMQKGLPTIQETIEISLEKIFHTPTRISPAGRTDTGVHALGQVISFVTESPIPPFKMLKAINAHLPQSIRFVDVREVPLTFNPRKDAILRWYRYQVVNRTPAPVLGKRYFTHVPYRLDFESLEGAVSLFRGLHDFTGFRSVDCTSKRTRLTLRKFQVTRDGDRLIFDLECRSFLQNMIRIVVGGAIEVARGRIPRDLLSEILETGKRDPRIPTYPPQGLILMRVYYPGDIKD